MSRILFFTLVIMLLLTNCNANSPLELQHSNTLEKTNLDSGLAQCPYGHTDSIIPVIYGFPSEEDFQKSDSGLVALGGCSLPENPAPWFCKIHQISF